MKMPEAIENTRRIVDLASEKQASDILLLDVREWTTFADFLVIMSAQSWRQMETLVEEIAQEAKRNGIRFLRKEGTPASGWILLDCGDIIVHIFSPQERDYYNLENVFVGARSVLRIQ